MCSEFGFGRRLNSWRVKVRPIVRVRTLSLPSLPVPLPSLPLPFPFFCHTYTSFPAHKTRTTGHDGVSLRTRQPGCSSRRRPTTHLLHQTKLSFFFLFFLPFFRFNLNRCRTTARPSHARRPLRYPRPSRLVVPMHRSSVLSTHASCAHSLPPPLPPRSTTRWVFFYFIFIFLTRTVAGQWRPQPRRPPHAHAGAPARLPPHTLEARKPLPPPKPSPHRLRRLNACHLLS